MRLPLELYDEILVHLWEENDGASLACCARVCRTLYPTAQQLFFRRLVLSRQVSEFRYLEKFLKLMSCAPHIADYIKILDICNFGVFGPALWIGSYTLLILQRLKNVVRIAFPRNANSRETQSFNWSNLNVDVSASFLAKFNVDSIREIDVSNIRNFPVHKLNSRIAPLSRLSLGGISPTPSSQSSPHVVKFRTDTLSIRAWSTEVSEYRDWLSHPHCALDKASVRRLELRYFSTEDHLCKPADVDKTPSLSLFPNIQHLHFTPFPAESPCYIYSKDEQQLTEPDPDDICILPVPNLALVPNLRSLTFQGDFYSTVNRRREEKAMFVSCIDILLALFGTLPDTSNHIERITFIVGIKLHWSHSRSIPAYIEDPPALSRWSDIVDILLSPQFPSLRQVQFDICAPDCISKEKKANILNRIKAHPEISRLKASKLLL